MKCVLTVPNVSGKNLRIGIGNNEFLGIQYIAAALIKKGFICDLLNAHAYRYSNEEVVCKIMTVGYDIVGVSCPSQKCYVFAKDLIKLLRKKGYKKYIVLGGFYATICYKEILEDLPEVDCISLGEGEVVFPSLVKALSTGESFNSLPGIAFKESNGEIKFSYPERITNLDELPFPVRDVNIIGESDDVSEVGMNMCGGRFFRITVGRGCYGRCSFCSILDFYKNCRTRYYRSAQNVVDELEMLVNKYGVNNFRFNDDIFYESSPNGIRWVHSFCEEVKKRNLKIEFAVELRANDIYKRELLMLKEIGLKKMSIGVESGVQRLLDEMKKDYTVPMLREKLKLMKECGITPAFTFITIVPTMSFEELMTNYMFIESLDCYVEKNLYNQLNIYTGCGYEQILQEKGLLLPKEHFYERHNYLFVDVRVKHFSIIIDRVVEESKKIKTKYMNMWKSDDEFYEKYDLYHEKRKRLIFKIIKHILSDLQGAKEEEFPYERYVKYIIDEYKNDFVGLDVT